MSWGRWLSWRTWCGQSGGGRHWVGRCLDLSSSCRWWSLSRILNRRCGTSGLPGGQGKMTLLSACFPENAFRTSRQMWRAVGRALLSRASAEFWQVRAQAGPETSVLVTLGQNHDGVEGTGDAGFRARASKQMRPSEQLWCYLGLLKWTFQLFVTLSPGPEVPRLVESRWWGSAFGWIRLHAGASQETLGIFQAGDKDQS